MERIEEHASFGGSQQVWRHSSQALGCDMQFGIFLPPQAKERPCPVVYWLSGLTCTEQNFVTKAGAQAHAARLGLIVVAPDTSPRGDHVPNDDASDLGQGASFYVNATEAPWRTHFQMETYVVEELPALVEASFPALGQRGILGHSMGGHGALVLSLRHPDRYRSVSAFAPIVAPSQVPWGQKAFAAYLGDDASAWKAHDAVALVTQGAHAKKRVPWLVHQGMADPFLTRELRPELLEAACEAAGHPLTLVRADGYDHSYYFVASFLQAHLEHHAASLRSG